MRIRPSLAIGVGMSTAAMYAATYSVAAISSPAAASAPPAGADASSSAEILHVSALSVSGAATLADAGVGASRGNLDGSGSPRTSASAANLTAALADQAVPDVLAVAQQHAPADHFTPATAQSVDGAVPGLATVDASTASARARWTGGASCPAPGAPLTTSTISTADVGTQSMPGVGSLLSLDGTASTSQSTALTGGTTRKVVTTAKGSAADVRLLDGQLRVAITDAPTLKATASGTSGGAKVSWNAPAVTVSLAGQKQTLPADGSPLDLTSPDNPLLHVELSLGQPEDVVESPNGTKASATATVLHVTADLGVGAAELGVLDADLFPLAASASAPAGGVDCGAGSNDTDGDGLTDVEERSGVANGAFDNAPSDPKNADTDGDGLQDGAEVTGSKNQVFGHAPTDPTDADTDGGSVKDGAEVSRGTDPNDAADDVDGNGDGGGGGGGTPAPDDLDGDGLSNQDEADEGTDPADPDSDGDGVDDGDEVHELQTSPTNPDTDGDRLNDGQESSRYDTDPLVTDTDKDGLSDGKEIKKYRTKPLKKDTDKDGLYDGPEVKGPSKQFSSCSTNPKKKDTDRDGLRDRAEVERFHTNPCDRDTDDGGISDGKEVQAGSDPLDPDSGPKHPDGRASVGTRLLGLGG